MKRRKGFTLIELLAVIVILGVIMLIATPIVLNIIEDSKKKAFEASAGNIARAAEIEYWNNTLMGPPKSLEFKFQKGEIVSNTLEFKGKAPESGIISVNKDGDVSMAIYNGKWCAIKQSDNKEIRLEKIPEEDCYIEEVVEYTDASCFGYEETKVVESFDIDYDACKVYFSHDGSDITYDELDNFCKGKAIWGNFTLKRMIDTEPGKLDEFIDEGVIDNLSGLKEGIKINYYSGGCPRDVAIPKTIDNKDVIVIKEYVFAEVGITSVIIPNSVTIIEKQAFALNNITELIIPKSVKTVAYEAFSNNLISKLIFRNGVEIIEEGAFSNNQLTEVFIPKSVKGIEDHAFGSNKFIDGGVVIDNCLGSVKLGYSVFYSTVDHEWIYVEPIYTITDCIKLAPEICFSFDEEKKMITSYDFDNCPRTIIIPDTINNVAVEHIGHGAFVENASQRCYWIDEDYYEYYDEVSMDYVHYEGDGYDWCDIYSGSGDGEKGGLYSVVLPNQLKSIKYSAFSQSSLKEIVIPNSVETIGESAFYYNNIRNLTMFEGIKKIEDNAFTDNLLTEVTIPESVQYLSGFGGNQLTEIIIPNSVVTIGDYAFAYNQFSSLTLENNVTKIGESAFSENQLTSLTLGNSVAIIDDYAFSNNQLNSLTLKNSVTKVGDYAFAHNGLTELSVPSSVKYLSGFYYNQLTNLTISNGVEVIGTDAFSNNQLTGVTLPNSMIDIKQRAFRLNKLTNIAIPDNVTTIGYSAFGENLLTNVTIGKGLREIENNPFYFNNPLVSLNVHSENPNYKSINNAIYSKDGTTLISGVKTMSNNIQPTVKVIETDAFRGMGLTSVLIPNGIEVIGTDAFSDNRLTEVFIPNSVRNINDRSFYSNRITQGNAKIDNSVGNVSIGTWAFVYNGTTGYQTITPTYLR